MHLQKIPLRNTHAFSEFFLKYVEQDAALQSFYSRFPVTENFKEQIKEKSSFPETSRRTLVAALQSQYKKIPAVPEAVNNNILSLNQKNTFTITTGHQLNIFTGPLYFIFKIVTVINICKQLKAQYSDCNFVPVYWMASEDHDYEEIRYFRLYGKKYTWETDQKGAVGRFKTKEIKSILNELPGDTSIFQEAYSKNALLSDAVRHYVNALFGSEGLVAIDADDASLKKIFEPAIYDDIINNVPFKSVNETNRHLELKGFHPQVHAREINFFYLDKNLRSRIEKRGNDFVVVDTDLKFSQAEIEKQITETPEKFSPNVILRPLYQEMILPNLAYIGGPAEVVYWLELKGVFNHFKIPFPMLMPRNFGMIIDNTTVRKIAKTGLEIKDFFEEKNYLFNHWIIKNASHDLSLGSAMTNLDEMMSAIQERAKSIDPTLGPMTEAETKRMRHGLEKIEKKMIRAEKRLQSDKLGQLDVIKEALFPNGSLQERTDNFLNFYQQDPRFIASLLKHFDPFDYSFSVLTYD